INSFHITHKSVEPAAPYVCSVLPSRVGRKLLNRGMSLRPAGISVGMTKTASERGVASAVGNDPERWVDEHGDVLYRYALERVRKPEVAQDLVQETFLAAVRTHERFRGGSTVRSWLCGILKHKICDYYRKRGRETSFTDLEFLSDECAD